MILYLFVGFWMGIYGLSPNQEFLFAMCTFSFFETLAEIGFIIVNWSRISEFIKNLFKRGE